MCLIDAGAESSLVNSAVINSLNLSRQPININMSTCGSSDSNNIKGLISLDLCFNPLAGKNLSWQSSFLEAKHTNDYPLIIIADIIMTNMTLLSQVIDGYWTKLATAKFTKLTWRKN